VRASPCPTELELDQAFSVGADPDLIAHLDGCHGCRTLWDETAIAVELARELPLAIPPVHHREERRTALLAAWDPVPFVRAPVQPAPEISAVRPQRRGRWAVAAIVLAAAATVAVVVAARHPSHDPEVVASHARRGVVHAHEGARFSLAAQPPDEIVRLRDGVIDIDVDPLSVGERFRVVVGTDEVEVRGTSFEVVATADHLVGVHVVHGRVEVKRAGMAPVVLTGGQAWHASTATDLPPPATPAPIVAPPAPSAPRLPSRSPPKARPADPVVPPPPAAGMTPPPKVTDPQEVAFNRGWDAMRLGEYGQAAAAFNRAVALAPDGALTEDATFWHAVAVARLHRTGEAIVAFRSFLDAFPSSTRAGEASAMLGWLLVETHELDEARRRFHAAETDPHEGARASALKGLETVGAAAN